MTQEKQEKILRKLTED
jgi:hypothetical protein